MTTTAVAERTIILTSVQPSCVPGTITISLAGPGNNATPKSIIPNTP